jgi:hypothetical protein
MAVAVGIGIRVLVSLPVSNLAQLIKLSYLTV